MDWNEIEALWRGRHDATQLDALDRRLAEAAQEDYGVLWRRARSAHFRALQAQTEREDEAGAQAAYAEGATFAEQAVAHDRTGVEGHFWYGVNALEAARRTGWLAGARTLPDATRHIERAMVIDEEYYFAAPLRVWGRIMHFKPLLLGGSVDRAMDIYRRALQIAPHNSTTLLYYAEALLADRQRKAARELLQRIVDAIDDPEWRWEQARDRGLAVELLERTRQV